MLPGCTTHISCPFTRLDKRATSSISPCRISREQRCTTSSARQGTMAPTSRPRTHLRWRNGPSRLRGHVSAENRRGLGRDDPSRNDGCWGAGSGPREIDPLGEVPAVCGQRHGGRRRRLAPCPSGRRHPPRRQALEHHGRHPRALLGRGLRPAAYHAARNGHEYPPGPGHSLDGATSGSWALPRYMAPEQFHEQADARTDVWGLGVDSLRAADPTTRLRNDLEIESKETRSPEHFVGNLPRNLEAICNKALNKDPGKRYATARDFAEDLRRWLSHEPIPRTRARTMRRLWLWSRRNKGWAAAIVLTVGLASVWGMAGA